MSETQTETCECGALATTEVFNGRDWLPICDVCWKDDECIWMEAVYEFNLRLHSAGFLGRPFAELHDVMDPNQLLDDFLQSELRARGLERHGEEWLALVNGAAERYDEWFATEVK